MPLKCQHLPLGCHGGLIYEHTDHILQRFSSECLSAAWALLIGWQLQPSSFLTTLDHTRADNVQYFISCSCVRTEQKSTGMPGFAFFLSRHLEIFLIYQPNKFFRVKEQSGSLGTLRSCKPVKEPCIAMFFSFPLTLFWPWAGSSHFLGRGKGWDSEGKEPLPSGLSPRLRKSFSPLRWSDAVGNAAMSSLQPSMPKSWRWEGLLAMHEHPAEQSRPCCLHPSCGLAKGSPDTTSSHPVPRGKCSSLNLQPRSVFNTALHKGRRKGSRSSRWYFFLNIIVLIPCLSSSWIICASSGTWLQLLWSIVAKTELINCRPSCCWIQPANHGWTISPARFVCLLKNHSWISSWLAFLPPCHKRSSHSQDVAGRAAAGADSCLYPAAGATKARGGRATWVSPSVCEGYDWNHHGKSPRGALLKSRQPKNLRVSVTDQHWGHEQLALGLIRFGGWPDCSAPSKTKPNLRDCSLMTAAWPAFPCTGDKKINPCVMQLFSFGSYSWWLNKLLHQTNNDLCWSSWRSGIAPFLGCAGGLIFIATGRSGVVMKSDWSSDPIAQKRPLKYSACFWKWLSQSASNPYWTEAAPCLPRQAGDVEPGQGKQH